jgi:nitrate/nitrite-specific signal transduction histidine kinase
VFEPLVLAAQLEATAEQYRRNEMAERSAEELNKAYQRLQDNIPNAMRELTHKDKILEQLSQAQTALINSYSIAIRANPMSQDLQVFKDIQTTGTAIAALMQQVAKVRGL